MRTLFLASVLLGALIAPSAMSAAVAAEPDWSGPYAGVGPSSVNVTVTSQPFNYQINQVSGLLVAGRGVVITPGTTRPAPDPGGGNGAAASIRAGYGWQAGPFVYGLDAEYGGGGGTGSTTVVTRLPPNALAEGAVITGTRTTRLSSTGALRARLGYATGRDLLYLTGGPAWADVTVAGTDTLQPDPTNLATSGSCPGAACAPNVPPDPVAAATSQRQRHTGTVLGAGWSHRLSRWTALTLEYTHASLGARDYSVTSTLTESCSAVISNVVNCGAAALAPDQRTTTSQRSFAVTASSLNLKLDLRLR